jgi:hypothetical protein
MASSGPSLPAPPVSATVTQPRSDPLTDPGSFASRKVENKLPSLKTDSSQAYGKPFTPPPPATPPVTQTAAVQPAPAPAQPRTSSAALPLAEMPPGAQSVLAASNGIETPVRFVPVPIVTQPERRPPPVPPVPQIPQAPQPNVKFVNAFSPPEPPGGLPNGGQGMMPMNAQGMMPMNPQGMMPPMMMGPGGMVPGYAPMSPYAAMAPGYPPMVGQTAMAPGYPQAMYAARYSTPYPMMAGQRPMGYGYPPMQPMMAPQSPYAPMGPQMAPGYLPARGNVPYVYQGPLPPNPFGQPMRPAGYAPVAPAGNWQTPGFNAAMDRNNPAPGMSVVQSAASDAIAEMMNVLKTSSYPSQREWAASNLASFDCHSHPQVVQALLTAAKADPAATVRAGCVYSLSRMGVTSEPVRTLLQQLKSDTDPRVRHEADLALVRLAPAQQPGTERNAVQPASAVVPR